MEQRVRSSMTSRIRAISPDRMIAIAALFISLAQLVLGTPVIIDWWFAPSVAITFVEETPTSATYVIRNDGNAAANNVRIEFSSMEQVLDISSMPDIGEEVVRRLDGRNTVVYKRIERGTEITLKFKTKELTKEERLFSAYPAYIWSDEGLGKIDLSKYDL